MWPAVCLWWFPYASGARKPFHLPSVCVIFLLRCVYVYDFVEEEGCVYTHCFFLAQPFLSLSPAISQHFRLFIKYSPFFRKSEPKKKKKKKIIKRFCAFCIDSYDRRIEDWCISVCLQHLCRCVGSARVCASDVNEYPFKTTPATGFRPQQKRKFQSLFFRIRVL